MANKKKHFDSDISKEFNRVLLAEIADSGKNQTTFGRDLGYLSQPSFNKLVNRKSIPTMPYFISLMEKWGYRMSLEKIGPAETEVKVYPIEV